ncbi:tudor domain-containing protein 7-like [Saccostrea echinata]|uniref:tudor domain-containing protein 7-like n=1 Tax=Saccostrea echinata TaxID=191078 RepID=UPI002A80D55C|nr:tudor domain-containing protein 7-like [Saccostrea echinata]
MALEEVKSMLRAVLMSCKEGVPAHILQRDYREITQEPLPFKKLGFSNLDEFINSIPDVVKVRRNKQGEIVYHAVANEETAHIQSMVAKQKGTKKKKKLKPAVRRPIRRSEPFKPFTQGGVARPPPRGKPPPWAQRPFQGSMNHTPYRARPPLLGKSPLNIQVNTSDESRRQVTVNRAFSAALVAATTETRVPDTGQYGRRYEIPPRFQKIQEGKENVPVENVNASRQKQDNASKQKPVSKPPMRQKKINFEKVPDGERYMEALKKYARDNNISLNFDPMPMKGANNPGFVSSVIINGKRYGSGDVYGSVEDSDFAAARTAVESLGLLSMSGENTSRTQSPLASEAQIKERVREMLNDVLLLVKGKNNGIWDTRLEVMYREQYNEDPPPDLVYYIEKWPDIVRVEACTLTGRNRLYPVTEEQVKGDHGVPLSLPRPITTQAGGDASQQNGTLTAPPEKAPAHPVVSQEIKELKVPSGENLPIGEKVSVYMTYLGDDGSFCVQHEDSAIFDITEIIDIVANGPVPELEDLEPGRFIAALYNTGSEELWSRAEILSREGTTVDVVFIDYGNRATCNQNVTRFLTEELARYPIQMIFCYLYGVAPLEGEEGWSKNFKEKFAEMVTDQKLTATTREILSDGTHTVDLFLSDATTSINDRLVSEGILRKLTEEEQEEASLIGEPEELELPSDNQWDVYVSYILTSTTSVMIRLVGENYSDKLEDLERKLEEAFHSAPEDVEINEGQVCVAYLDELFHRVRVIKKEDKKYECYFLDHGDVDGLIPDQLRILDPNINKLLPYQAFEVSLDGLEAYAGNVTAPEKLCDMALGKTLVAEVTARDGIFSVVLYDTQGDTDVNINQEILKAVQLEAETSLLAAAGSNPQSTESSPLPQRRTTELSTQPNTSPQSLSPKRQPQNSVTSNTQSTSVQVPKESEPLKKNSRDGKEGGTDSWETESGEGSWETEEEEVLEGAVSSKRKPVSSGAVPKSTQNKTSDRKKLHNVIEKSGEKIQISGPVKEMTQGLSSLTTQDTVISDSPLASEASAQDQGTQNLYTWRSSGKPPEKVSFNHPYENDEIALMHTEVYNTRPVPKTFVTPPKGEYLDIHIINIFDPTNFVCIPFQHMTESEKLLNEMLEYFNSQKSLTLKDSDLVEGQMYAGNKDDMWYRVVVKNKITSRNLASVYLCDWGEFTIMSVEAIKPLPYCFTKLPQLAFKGKLYGVKPAKDSHMWSEAAKYKFIQMAHNRSLVALICGKEEVGGQELVSMRLMDTSDPDKDVCLDEVLLEMGVAEKVRFTS